MGKRPKYTVPIADTARTMFTVAGNEIGAVAAESSLGSRMYMATMTFR